MCVSSLQRRVSARRLGETAVDAHRGFMMQSASQFSAQQQHSDFTVVTPRFKTQEPLVRASDVTINRVLLQSTDRVKSATSASDLSRKYSEHNGDYKAERSSESYHLRVIDPKVDTNAFIPASANSYIPRHRQLTDDFRELLEKKLVVTTRIVRLQLVNMANARCSIWMPWNNAK